MHDTDLPVFVYGTLRHGLGNYGRILAGNTVHEQPATLPNVTMYNAGGFPFVSLDGENTVTGEVMYLDPRNAEMTMRRLDRLEGFQRPGARHNMYERTQVDVTLADGITLRAWTYVTSESSQEWTEDMDVLESGDWVAHEKAMRAHRVSGYAGLR